LRRPIAEMHEMHAELFKVYSVNEDFSLLYDDGKDHVGDFAVIRWHKDNQLYRVQVIQELSNGTVNLKYYHFYTGFNNKLLFLLNF
jgi:hypothetical protein